MMLPSLGETQPKGCGGGGGESREDIVLAKSAELLADTGSGGLGAGSVIGGLVALGAPPPPRSEL